jgi:glycosyltransferase involved in cell wall biosynthesis
LDKKNNWILQLCHGINAPFDDVARQWTSLFKDKNYKILTVFLTGKPDGKIKLLIGGEVVFLEYNSRDLRGLKRKQIKKIRSLHKHYQFSFAIAHRYKSIYIASHLPEVPLIGVSHAYGVYKSFIRRLYVMNRAKTLMLAGVSDAIRDDARKSLPNYKAQNIQTVHNHIDVEKNRSVLLSRDDARAQLGLDESSFVIGNVGRLHPDKDQTTLIEAFALALPKTPSAKLVIIGDGRLKGELENLIISLGCEQHILLLGQVPEASRYYKAFDVFALSSYYEPFGMVLLEAMSAAIPIICSNCGGGAEVVGDKGLLFDVGDKRDLAGCLIRVFENGDEFRNKMSVNLMARLTENFTDEAVREHFWKLPFVRKELQ